MSDSPAASMSGLRPRASPDRPQGHWPTESHWGLPVLAHRASAHAQGLRLRGAGPPLACTAAARMAFPTLQRGRHPGGVISELNGWPARSPADASPATLPPPPHGLGPRWLATPSVLGSSLALCRFIPALSVVSFGMHRSGSCAGRGPLRQRARSGDPRPLNGAEKKIAYLYNCAMLFSTLACNGEMPIPAATPSEQGPPREKIKHST